MLYRVFVAGDVRTRPWVAVSAVLLGTVMTGMFTRDFSLSLADLRGAYGLTFDEGAELNTITNALQLLLAPCIPIGVFIFGARRILMIGGIVFTVVMLLTPLAVGLPAVFALHGMIGILLGCFVPTTLATVFANLPPRFWLIALALYAARLTLTINVSVPLSGFLVEQVGWQAIYWQAGACGAIMVVLAAVSLPDKPTNMPALRKLNIGEIALFCIGLALLYAAVDQGNRLDWLASGTIVALLGGGASLLTAFFVWQHFAPLPFAHPRAALRRNIFLPLLIAGIYGLLSLGSGLLIPNFLATFAHLKADTSGEVLWWLIGGQLMLVPAAVWLIRRVDARITLALGLAAMAYGCWLGSFVTSDWRADNFVPVVIAFAIGNAFTFFSALVIVIANARPPEVVGMIAYVQIFRLLGPALGGAILTTLLRKREAIHSVLLMPYIDRARATALHLGDTHHGTALGALIRREANVLAFRDAYEFCFIVALVCLVLAACIGRSPTNPLTPGDRA